MLKKLFVLSLPLLLTYACQQQETPPAELMQMHCGSCHLPPDPATLSKRVWRAGVLPEMAARLGVPYAGFDPTAGKDMQEAFYIRQSGTYPEVPMLDTASWWRLHDYIVQLAPDSIAVDTNRSARNQPLRQFSAKLIALPGGRRTSVTALNFQTGENSFAIGTVAGQHLSWPDSAQANPSSTSPLTNILRKDGAEYLTEVGVLNPSELREGKIMLNRLGGATVVGKDLHRPVHTNVTDLDGDGKDEVIVCEFGNLTGSLSLFSQSGSQWQRTELLQLPGSVNTVVEDMDGDGKLDIVVLIAQGDEGIFILYQTDPLTFRPRRVVQLPPQYGSSWFALADTDRDGDQDLVLVNGDNADYSNILKPFHGVRVFENTGGTFTESFFYPIYGATRVEVDDFNGDGWPDFAILSYFPDFRSTPEESFVLLASHSNRPLSFTSHTTPLAERGRWLVMEAGDFDADGDKDLLLGAFFLPPGSEFRDNVRRWAEEGQDLLLLENQLSDR